MELAKLLEKILLHDARLEVLAAELLASKELAFDALVVRPKSSFKRAYNRDVTGFEVATPNKKRKSEAVVTLDVSREGMYDALPEFLFHEPEPPSAYKTLEQRAKSSERGKEEEAQARQFFLPFEQEFFRKKIQVELEERKLLSGIASPVQQMIFDKFWTDIGGVDAHPKAILFYLLPLTHQIAGDLPLMEQCFESVLREKVRMRKIWRRQATFEGAGTPELGGASLGADFILGGSVVEELPELEVTVGPVELNAVPDYLGGGQKHRLLAILHDYFVPVELEASLRLVLKQEEDESLRLRDGVFLLDEEAATARLGYSTVI